MNHVKLTMLVAQAHAAVVAKGLALVDFPAEAEKAREAARSAYGALEQNYEIDEVFLEARIKDLKADVEKHLSETATTQLAEAQRDAIATQKHFSALIVEVEAAQRELYEAVTKAPHGLPPEFDTVLRDTTQVLIEASARSHQFLKETIDMLHNFELKHCFMRHLVPEDIAKQLAALYKEG